MANDLNISIKLSDEMSQGLSAASDTLESFSKVAKNVGRELSQVGQTFSLVGASITGPFILALSSASKTSSSVSAEFKKLQSITGQFQTQIAESVVPVFEKFNNILNGLLQRFNALDPATKSQITQALFLGGVFLTLGGIMTIIIGKTISLASNIAGLISSFMRFAVVNPVIVAVAGTIVGIISLMLKFKAVADVVMNTFEIVWQSLKAGWLSSAAAMHEFVGLTLQGLAWIFDALSNLPGPTKKVFSDLSMQLSINSAIAKRFAVEDMKDVHQSIQRVGEILSTGKGEWSSTFDEMKTKAQDFFREVLQGNSEIAADTSKLNEELRRQEEELSLLRMQLSDEDYMNAFRQNQEKINLLNFYKQEYMIAHQGMAAFTATLGQSIQTNLSGAISDVVMGTKKAKDAFAEFGKAMIQAIVNFMAQKLVAAALEKTLLAGTVVASSAAGAAVAAAWAPAAAMVSLATLGTNAAPAAAALISVNTLAGTLATLGAIKGKISSGSEAANVASWEGGREQMSSVASGGAWAEGGSGIVNRPTLFLAGEAGPEAFKFTPMRGGRSGGSGGDGGAVEVNIYIQSANLSSSQDISSVGEDLGIRTARALRTARS